MSVCPKCGSEMQTDFTRETKMGEDGEIYIEPVANTYCPNCDILGDNADKPMTKEELVKVIEKDLAPRLQETYLKGTVTGYISLLNIITKETRDFTSAKKFHKYLRNKYNEISETFKKIVNDEENKSTEETV